MSVDEKKSNETLDLLVKKFEHIVLKRLEKVMETSSFDSFAKKPIFKNSFEQFKEKPWFSWSSQTNKPPLNSKEPASESDSVKKTTLDIQNRLVTKLEQTNMKIGEVRDLLKNISKSFDDRRVSNKDELLPTVFSKPFKTLVKDIEANKLKPSNKAPQLASNEEQTNPEKRQSKLAEREQKALPVSIENFSADSLENLGNKLTDILPDAIKKGLKDFKKDLFLELRKVQGGNGGGLVDGVVGGLMSRLMPSIAGIGTAIAGLGTATMAGLTTSVGAASTGALGAVALAGDALGGWAGRSAARGIYGEQEANEAFEKYGTINLPFGMKYQSSILGVSQQAVEAGGLGIEAIESAGRESRLNEQIEFRNKYAQTKGFKTYEELGKAVKEKKATPVKLSKDPKTGFNIPISGGDFIKPEEKPKVPKTVPTPVAEVAKETINDIEKPQTFTPLQPTEPTKSQNSKEANKNKQPAPAAENSKEQAPFKLATKSDFNSKNDLDKNRNALLELISKEAAFKEIKLTDKQVSKIFGDWSSVMEVGKGLKNNKQDNEKFIKAIESEKGYETLTKLITNYKPKDKVPAVVPEPVKEAVKPKVEEKPKAEEKPKDKVPAVVPEPVKEAVKPKVTTQEQKPLPEHLQRLKDQYKESLEKLKFSEEEIEASKQRKLDQEKLISAPFEDLTKITNNIKDKSQSSDLKTEVKVPAVVPEPVKEAVKPKDKVPAVVPEPVKEAVKPKVEEKPKVESPSASKKDPNDPFEQLKAGILKQKEESIEKLKFSKEEIRAAKERQVSSEKQLNQISDSFKSLATGVGKQQVSGIQAAANSSQPIDNNSLKKTAQEATNQTNLLQAILQNNSQNFDNLAKAMAEAGINFKATKPPVVVNNQKQEDVPRSNEIAKQSSSPVLSYRTFAQQMMSYNTGQ